MPSKHTVITSFTQEGYDLYGKTFLETMLKHFVRPVVYWEGPPCDFDTELAEWRTVTEVTGHDWWMEMIAPFPLMKGATGAGYSINYDARMVRKPFMQAHTIKERGGKVFWMDADTFVHSDVPEGFLDEMLPDDKFCCYLGRDFLYTESGFIGFNADHPICTGFFDNYINVFMSGAIFSMGQLLQTKEGQTFHQSRWHDCEGFDAIRKAMQRPDAFVDLAAGLPDKTMHPYINSVLGKYFDHRKGPRKEGRSTQKDLVVPRTEEYWKHA